MCRILLVVDDADLRELWTMVLDAEGAQCRDGGRRCRGDGVVRHRAAGRRDHRSSFPKLPGLALIALVRSLQADARIIAVSGNNAKLPEPGARSLHGPQQTGRDPALGAAVRSLVPDERYD